MLGDRRQRHRVRRRQARPTVRSPASSAVRIARRVGSASAAKIRSRSGGLIAAHAGVVAAAAAKVNRSVESLRQTARRSRRRDAAGGFVEKILLSFKGLYSDSARRLSLDSGGGLSSTTLRQVTPAWGGAGAMADEPFSERLKRLEDRIAAARAGRAEPSRGAPAGVHPGLAGLADGDRAGRGDGPRAGDRIGARRAVSAPGRCSWWCSPSWASPPACGRCSAPPGGAERQGRGRADARPGRRGRRTDGLRGKPMAEEAGGSGLNIHPMEQFEVQPLFGGDRRCTGTPPPTRRSGWRWRWSPSAC